MTFLSTLASTFFTNYIIWIIFSYIKPKNGRLIYTLLITFFEIGTIIFLLVFAIKELVFILDNYSVTAGDLILYFFSDFSYALGILTAYIITMFLTLSGVRLFKGRRLKKFQNELEGKKPLSITLANIFILISGLILIGIGITIIVVSKELNAYFFTFTISGLLISVFGIILMINNRKEHVEEEKLDDDIILLIKVDENIFSYKYEYNKENKFEDLVGKLLNDYILTNFGELKIDNNKYKLLGIIADDFDYSYILDIKLDKDRRDFKNIISNVSRYNKVKISADTNLNVINVKKIK